MRPPEIIQRSTQPAPNPQRPPRSPGKHRPIHQSADLPAWNEVRAMNPKPLLQFEGCSSVWSDHRQALLLSLIRAALIGLDRMLGFGLKYPTRFKDTHLNPDRHALETANSPFGSLRQGTNGPDVSRR